MFVDTFVAQVRKYWIQIKHRFEIKDWLQDASSWELARIIVLVATVVLAVVVAPLSNIENIQRVGTKASYILSAQGSINQAGLVCLSTEGPILAGYLSRDNLRYALTTIATAQASILAIVFSVTFIGVQLVSTSYTLRTLGQINPSTIFAKTYAILGVSILFDIALILLLPSILTDRFAFWGVSAVLLFVFSLLMLQDAVKETINLSTPSGLARSIRRAISIRDHFQDPDSRDSNRSKNQAPTDPLKSLILSATRSREWGTVEEGYDELIVQVHDLIGELLRIQYGLATQGWLKRLSLRDISIKENDKVIPGPTGALESVFVSHYRQIMVSSLEAKEQQKFREYTSDLYSFGVLCFRVGLPQAGKSTFDGLTETMKSISDGTQNSECTSLLLKYKIELLVPAVKLGQIEAALHICKGLENDLIDSPDETLLTGEIRRAAIVAISWSMVELLQKEGKIESSFRDLTLAKSESDLNHIEEDLLIRLTDFHREVVMQWAISNSSKICDETKKSAIESWEQISRHSQKVGQPGYVEIMLYNLISEFLIAKSGGADPEFSDERLGEILSRASLGINRDRVLSCVTECKQVLETEREKVGSGSQPGWKGNWIENLGEINLHESIEVLDEIPDQMTSHYRREVFRRIGLDSICSAIRKDCSVFLGQNTSVVTKLDDVVFLCKREGSGHSVVVVSEELTAENSRDIESIFDSMKESAFISHVNPDFEVLTCHVEDEVDCSSFTTVEKELWKCIEGNQAKLEEYTFEQPRQNIDEITSSIIPE